MMIWYEFQPADTLFFKSAAPLVKGENHSALTQFPPAPETISGAVRTAILKKNNLSPVEYKAGKGDKELIAVIGEASTPAPFYVIGPLLKKGNDLFIPAPYSWFTDDEKSSENKLKNNMEKDKEKKKLYKVYKVKTIKSELLQTSSGELSWTTGQSSELSPLGGRWIKLSDLNNEQPEVLNTTDFYQPEIRTGIELEEKNRRVKEHHLYSLTHIRLKAEVSLVFGIDRQLPLNDKGILSLGGEKRFGLYHKTNIVNIPAGRDELFMILGPVLTDDLARKSMVAVGKIMYRGGWDLAKGFHKPMKGYYPAGSVFNQRIDENCIQL